MRSEGDRLGEKGRVRGVGCVPTELTGVVAEEMRMPAASVKDTKCF